MKRKIHWISVFIVLSLAFISGCSSRDDDETPHENNNQQERETKELPNPSPSPEAPQLPGDNSPPEMLDEPPTAQSTNSEQSVALDLSQVSKLSSERKDWGPGGPVDELNRSQSALSYQEQFSDYDASFIGSTDEKVIYLTFDQGYENGFTSQILDTLKEKDVKAVFFLTGHYVESQPDLVQRMVDEGHVLANHSWGHPDCVNTSLEEVSDDIMKLHNYIKEHYDYNMDLFRFPAGAFNEQTLALLQKLGYHSVFWSFAYMDWEVDNQPDPAVALESLKSKAHPGGIYLLHSVGKTNATILSQFIDDMKSDGYTFEAYKAD